MKISTVFFDLGSTLVYSKYPWPPIYARADREMIKVLQEAGIRVDSTSFYVEFGGFIQSYYAKTARENLELIRDVGREALIENGDWLVLHRARPIDMPRG